MLEIVDLHKRYGEFEALKSLSLTIPKGEVFAFLGPNGAGKTTTLRMITGLLRPTRGVVRVGGFDVHREPTRARACTAFIPDRPYVYEKLTASEFMRFSASLRSMDRRDTQERIEMLLEIFDLAPWGDRLIENFSHGMKQRLVVASALLVRPQLLVVDEPMVGLDPQGARLIKTVFRRVCEDAGMTVFLSTHSLEVAEELAHRVAILHRGRVVALGTLDELRETFGARGKSLEEMFLQITAEAEGEDAESGSVVAHEERRERRVEELLGDILRS